MQQKVAAQGTASNAAFNALVNSASFVTVGPPSLTNQRAHQVLISLRKMTELAFRYQMSGNVNQGNNAKSILLTACNYFIPDANTNAQAIFQNSTYPCALGLTFDMVYPLLSASEKATVVNHLEQWLTEIITATNLVSYSQYSSAMDNGSFSWIAGAALTGLAIWGDSNYPNLENVILDNLQKLQTGYLDAISPDGSVDESFGYYNYGNMNSLNAAIACENSGWGDILAGTNVLKTPRWIATALVGGEFPWIGDSSINHKGLRLDPIGYYLINRTQDEVGLWGQLRVEAVQPITEWTVSQSYSPWLIKAIHYPEGLNPQPPALLSGFFRDNMNQGTPNSNVTTPHFGVGEGGHALLHNSSNPSDKGLAVFYQIRDEWMNHNHEDDGHVAIISQEKHHHRDPGYSGVTAAQSTSHNIVVVSGAAGFNGNSTNYYVPPSPNGRFLGKKQSSALTATFDYVRGSHENMWMMQRADRTVMMVKDPNDPYAVVISNVKKDSNNRTYQELWWGSAYATGQGTSSSPMSIYHGGKTLRSVYLSPSSVSVSTGGTVGTAKRSLVSASGVEVSFVSVHGAAAPSSTAPLNNPSAGTSGGIMTRSSGTDKILVSTDGSAIGDFTTTCDGRLAWIRTSGGVLTEWIAAEATDLVDGPEDLLTASEEVSIAVRQGEIHVITTSGNGAANLSLQAYAPFTVSAVTVDGDPTSLYSQSGNLVSIGGGAPPTGPQISLDDRFYHFNEGDGGDLANLSPAVLLANDGTLTSTGGWATASLKGGASYQPRPISLGMSATFLPGSYGHEAVVFAGTAQGAGDVFELRVGPQGYAMSVDLFQGGTAVLSAQVPLDLSGCHGRFTLTYDPVLGTAEILDPLGQSFAFGSVSLLSSPFFLDVAVTSFARIDDLAIFDSAEDGVTPQGVVFWGVPSGRAGYAVHAPLVLASQNATLLHNGTVIDPVIANYWFFATGMVEGGASPYLATPGQPPATIRQIFFESTATALLTVPGQEAGVALTTAGSEVLTGLYAY